MKTLIASVVGLILCLTNLFSLSVSADDWRAIRGNDGTGVVESSGVLSQGSAFGLKVAWKKEIGSGYSSVVIADDRIIVMYNDGDFDVVAALSAADGEMIWKSKIGPKFVGKNGSFDGPIATPVVDGSQIFVVSPVGKLICFQSSDGKKMWSRDLQKADEAPLPLYGFTTSPVVFEDLLILQTGAKDKSLAAFNKANGEPVWSCTNDEINSQIPVLATIGHQSVLLAAGGNYLSGVEPKTGHVLFEYEHGGENGSAMMPVVFDENKVLMTLNDRFSKAVALRPVDDQINVSQDWQQPTIKNT